MGGRDRASLRWAEKWRESLENSDNPVKKREIFGWAFFDFANSSYVTVVITAIYSSFFVKYVIPEDHPAPNSLWSSIIVVGTIIAMLLSPLAGAICDLAGKKKGVPYRRDAHLCGVHNGLVFCRRVDPLARCVTGRGQLRRLHVE